MTVGNQPDFTVKPELWTIGELVQRIRTDELMVPRFQRGRRWDSVKQERLIDSLFQNYPINALIIHDHGSGQTLVDGLQRSTTFLDYEKEPLERAPLDRILTDNQAASLFEAVVTEAGGSVDTGEVAELTSRTRDLIRTWARHTRSLRAGSFTTAKLVDALRPVVEELNDERADEGAATDEAPNSGDIGWLAISNALNHNETINEIREQIRNQVAIADKTIPVLIFKGRLGRLAEIFERMNENVVPLSKYEIFAAAWTGYTIDIPDSYKALQDILLKRYRSFVEDTGVGIEDFDPEDATIENITLFEFLYAFSHYLADKFPLLFPTREIGADVPTSAFQITSLALGVDLEEMETLPEVLWPRITVDGETDPTPLIEAVSAACEIVNAILKPLIGLEWKTTGARARTFIAHSDSQINSIIARALVAKFDPTEGFSSREGRQPSADIELLQKGVIGHYVREILDGEWRGNTFSLAFRRVWHEHPGRPSPFYATPLDAETLVAALESWYAGGREVQTKSRGQPSQKDRLFLQCFYGRLGVAEVLHKKWHIDHIVPIGAMKKAIMSGESPGLPMNSIANLAAVPQDKNLGKGQRQLVDLLQGKKAAEWRSVVDSYYSIDDAVVPEVPALEEGDKAGFDAFADEYLRYLDTRWRAIRDEAIDHFRAQGWLHD